MLPFQSIIIIDKLAKISIYQQITGQFIILIKNGMLQSGQKIASSREMSKQLGVHRKTVVLAYDDLVTQGWLDTKAGSGTFVAKNLPEIVPLKLNEADLKLKQKAGFYFEENTVLNRKLITASEKLHLDDGFPDPRLAPLIELSQAYRSNLLRGNKYIKLGYGDTKGSFWLREQLAIYLNETRGLNISAENLLIVRGTIMAFYLNALAFLKKGDAVVIGQTNWTSALMTLKNLGANIITIPIDENGIVVDALAQICERQPIRMIYVTPHHDYPTTITLKADRRIQLLKLAQKYRFIIFEDDYDFDFHYQSRPILPLASADESGLVLYAGSFTKSISPAFRVGYLVATEDVVEHLAAHRRIIDRQGDTVLENAIAELLQEGVIQKYLRKSLKEYRQRRDYFCDLLKTKMSDLIQFNIPEGGMAVWTNFDKKIDLPKTAANAFKNGLFFSDGSQHGNINATRLGFASSTIDELEQAVMILQDSIVEN
jgi:GntR family transcriptional regulator / MocR family aminotransferase